MMENIVSEVQLDEKTILQSVIRILEDMTSDWDLDFSGGIKSDTRLIADLAFESIDMVQFVVAIEEKFMRRDLPFEKLLMVNGRYVDDLSVAEVSGFLQEHLIPKR
jgi:acyl carrier protein